MAVDLTPRFRRLNSQKQNFNGNVASVQHGFSGPFSATQLWHNIIHALKTQVEVRSCRRHLRVHAECFTGSDAVDAVLSFLMQNVLFCTSEVTRLKAARLCQALMEANLFKSVGSKLFCKEKEMLFEDSTCSLYRFMEPGITSKDKENIWTKEMEIEVNKGARWSEPTTISDPTVTGLSDRKFEGLLLNINLQLPTSPSHCTVTPLLSSTVVEKVWKQQALLQLLQIVEVPLLDSILTSPATVQPKTKLAPLTAPDLVFYNACLERELLDTLNLHPMDNWLSAAADLLELFPDQLIVVAGEQLSHYSVASTCDKEHRTNQKRLIFDMICKYYCGQEKRPLISEHYLDIQMAILQLIYAEKNLPAIKATQLCFQLLDSSVRDELRRLLTFMAMAAHPEAERLQKQMDNQSLVCKVFQRAMFQHFKLNPSQTEALTLFLMANHIDIFKTPQILINSVGETLRKIQQGEDPDSAPFFTFCEQMTSEEFEEQCMAATSENLGILLRDILKNKKMPDKQKKKIVKQFEKYHPVVFFQHFDFV